MSYTLLCVKLSIDLHDLFDDLTNIHRLSADKYSILSRKRFYEKLTQTNCRRYARFSLQFY